ncbi:MAG: methyl-accepting chemotaxis sensory transducer [Gemmatimonadetes bacterium]|nr:methyl-accepting chemotaxis sensory transducer [Gemmatimonadota bacterium]
MAVAVVCALPATTHAQALTFRHLTVNSGLPASQINDIRQDARGFVWVSTSGGLSRYDGYVFTTYRHRRGDPRSLPNSHTITVYEDRAGTMWVGTRSGLSRFDRQRDSFDNFMVRERNASSERTSVHAILEDRAGRFWVGTKTGLYLFDRRTTQARLYPLPGAPAAADVRQLYEDSTGHLWIGVEGFGLYALSPTLSSVHRHALDHNDANTIPSNDIRSIVQVDDQLWIATANGGLASLTLGTGRIVRYRHDPAKPASIASNRVLRLLRDRDRGLWIGTEDHGLDFLDPSTGVFRHYESNPDDPATLSGSSVWSLFQETNGALWAGTFTGGVSISRLNGSALHLYRSLAGQPNSLSDNNVVGFHEDRRGRIWIATDGGGLNRFDRATGIFTRYNTSNSTLKSNAVLGVTEDADGVIWAGGWAGGITRLDAKSGAMTTYTTATSDIPSNDIFSVHVDRQGRLWAGSFRNGLLLMDRKRGTFTAYPIVPAGRASPLVWLIRELADGRLALATGDENEGLAIFDPRTSGVTWYQSDPHDSTTLSSNTINALLEETPGVLWVGTGEGLDRLILATGDVQHFSEKDGIPGPAVDGLAWDHTGRLWMSTDRGVARFDPATRTSKKLAPGDGLQGNEFVARSYLEARDGTIFFGGTNGFNTIIPDRLVRDGRIPPIAITSFQLFNEPVVPGAPGSPLTAPIWETHELTLSHDQAVLTFGFAALDFSDPGRNRYEYRLDGVDKDWIRAGAARTASYSHLPQGHYVFRVKGSNSDGVWNNHGATIKLVIEPALWETAWVRLLAALAVLAVIALAARNARSRHQRLARMNRQLTDASEHDRHTQRYLEGNVLEMLDAMQRYSTGDYSVALGVNSDDPIGKLRHGFNMVVADRKQADDELRQSQKMEAVGRLAGGVAHDFNNLLTVIKGNVELALQDIDGDAPVRGELVEVQKAADRAAMLTRQLLAFSRKQILQPQTLSLNAVVVEVGGMLQRTLGEDILLKTVLDPELGMIRADPGQVQQVLLNLVVNARDAMPRGGMLVIQARHATEAEVSGHAEAIESVQYLALSVRDTGEGMTPALIDRVFEPFFTTKEQGKGTGLGLSTVYGIVSQSGGYVRVESELDVGSAFTVYLPKVDGELYAVVPDAPIVSGDFETVLLVEDERAVRLLSARVLRRSGYNVLLARNGGEALALAERFTDEIHLLLTDVVMPGMSGRELAQQLMPLRPSMRLLYVSGYTEDETVRHGVSGLRTAFLEKPFTPDALVRKVREVLGTALVDASAA